MRWGGDLIGFWGLKDDATRQAHTGRRIVSGNKQAAVKRPCLWDAGAGGEAHPNCGMGRSFPMQRLQ